MPWKIDSGVAALLGAVVGGCLSVLATFVVQWRQDSRQRRNLSVAIAGEVSALVEMIRRRKYPAGVHAAAVRAGQGDVFVFQVMLPPEILVVSRSAMNNMGLLAGQLPSLLPRAVMMADAIAADFNRLMAHGKDGESSVIDSREPDKARDFYAELLGLLLSGLEMGDRLVVEVKRQYPKVEIETAELSDYEQALATANEPTRRRLAEPA